MESMGSLAYALKQEPSFSPHDEKDGKLFPKLMRFESRKLIFPSLDWANFHSSVLFENRTPL